MIVDVKMTKICKEAKLPTYATSGSVGMDFYSLNDEKIYPGHIKTIRTGIKIQLPKFTEMVMRQRSGLSKIFPNYIMIGVGTIDFDYRGEIKIPIINNSKTNVFEIKAGDKIAQGIIHPIFKANPLLVDELDETERGEGGFGHTGVR
jgi:dUTP pyrophosphatase